MKRTTFLLICAALLLIVVAVLLFRPTVEEPLVPPQEQGQQLTAYLTGYTWWDNTPQGTPVIAFSRSWEPRAVHEVAGGVGTYEDPITLAVGHVIEDGVSTPDFEPGTIFYVPNVRRYFVVEDTCGDGATPQEMPCHNLQTAEPGAEVWLDMWIGGSADDQRTIGDACMYTLTGIHLVIKDPLPTYLVDKGPLFYNGECAEQYGNRAVLQQ